MNNIKLIGSSKIDIAGYKCPFVKENPVVIELPGIQGYYVPVFKELSDLENAMRYIKLFRYRLEMVGNTDKFYEIIREGGARIVVNPKGYNGITVWDAILPMSEGLILPG